MVGLAEGMNVGLAVGDTDGDVGAYDGPALGVLEG